MATVRSSIWPSLETPAGLHLAVRNGYFACLLICLTTFGLILLGGTALGATVDLCFFFMAGVGIRSFSRLAAGSAMVMLLTERTAAMATGHLGASDLLGLMLLPILFHATHAGFAARTMGITAEAPVIESPGDWLESMEALPGWLWPRIWVAFRFYLVGLIALMLASFAVRYSGLLS